MKILSKYKDFYDYLTGIYGEDPLLVLDRREHKQPDWQFPSANQWGEDQITKYNLWVGNYNIEFLRCGYEFYYGENIFDIPTIKQVYSPIFNSPQRNLYGKYENINKENILAYRSIDTPEHKVYGANYILKNPVETKRPEFLPNDVVIAIGHFENENSRYDFNYPILKDINLNKFIPAEQVYKMVSDYLSLQRTKAEDRPDNRSNVEKIETNGFDKQISFRGK